LCPDDEWVETSDALQGTAVFDATGDLATMPSWDELVRQHADRVYRLAYRLAGNQQDAEDLTQETFIRVFRSVQNYQPGTLKAGCHRITTNLFLDMVRRRPASGWKHCPTITTELPADEPNPEQIYHDSRLGPDLQAALDSLPPEFRAAVVLCDIEGLSYEEIGATLGVKLGYRPQPHTSRRQALRDYLAAHPEQGERMSHPSRLSSPVIPRFARFWRASGGNWVESRYIRHMVAAKGRVMADQRHVFRRAFSWLPRTVRLTE